MLIFGWAISSAGVEAVVGLKPISDFLCKILNSPPLETICDFEAEPATYADIQVFPRHERLEEATARRLTAHRK